MVHVFQSKLPLLSIISRQLVTTLNRRESDSASLIELATYYPHPATVISLIRLVYFPILIRQLDITIKVNVGNWRTTNLYLIASLVTEPSSLRLRVKPRHWALLDQEHN